MAGFNSPNILFLNTYDSLDRKYVAELVPRLMENGYERFVELYAGAFAIPLVESHVGVSPERMWCCDVTLYSNILGYTFSGRDLSELGVAVDGKPVRLSGDPIMDAGTLLYEQALCRLSLVDNDYYHMLVEDMVGRRDAHVAHLAAKVKGMDDRLHGLTFETMYLWDGLERWADVPHTFICSNPPTYKGAYEDFFDTDGRMTWNSIDYPLWDGKVDCPLLAERSEGREALVLFLQQADKGHAATEEPVSARYLSETQNVYYNSNRPEEVIGLIGAKSETATGAPIVKSKATILEEDYEVTRKSKVTVAFAETSVAEYYRSIWLHRIRGKSVSVNLGVYIDGKVAGFIGLLTSAVMSPYHQKGVPSDPGPVVLAYAVPAPNNRQRLARLLVEIAKSKKVVEAALAQAQPSSAMAVQAATQMKTVEYSRFKEVKGLRGLMRLESSKPDNGVNALTYVADLNDRTMRQILSEFVDKEAAFRRKHGK